MVVVVSHKHVKEWIIYVYYTTDKLFLPYVILYHTYLIRHLTTSTTHHGEKTIELSVEMPNSLYWEPLVTLAAISDNWDGCLYSLEIIYMR